MIKHFLAVAIGGAIGASSRYALNIMLHSLNKNILWSTLSANLIGCLLMGLMYRWVLNNIELTVNFRLFVMVGVLGALTTWSTFSMETVILMEQGHILKAFGYTMLTMLGCFAAFWLGWKI